MVFSFLFKIKQNYCKQIVETLIRHCVVRHLIWACTVCLCPTKRRLGLYGLKISENPFRNGVIKFCLVCLSVYHAWLTVTETECQDPDIRDLDSEAGGNYISAISPLVSGLYCRLVLCPIH